MQSLRSLFGQPYRPIVLSRNPPTSSSAPYRETRKTPRDQRSRWIPVAPAAPRYLAKVRRFGSRKAIQNQSLTKSVLNPRSREVQRQTAGENEFGISAGMPQSGDLCAKPVLIGLPARAKARRECSARKDWRRERNCKPTVSRRISRRFAALRRTGVLPGFTPSLPPRACADDRPSRRCAGQQPPLQPTLLRPPGRRAGGPCRLSCRTVRRVVPER